MGKRAENEPQGKPLLEVLVDDTVRRFKTTYTFVNKFGKREPYHLYKAAEDAIVSCGIPPAEILVKLRSQTLLTPKEVGRLTPGDLLVEETWEEFDLELSHRIVSSEISSRYPELEQEEQERLNDYEIHD